MTTRQNILLLAFAVLTGSSAMASGYHTGYCRYGEECEGIVSQNLREAQKICSHEAFDWLAIAVRQRQRDGSVKFIGYTCTTPPGGN